eukprot:GHRQ01013898.1.p1 GENE.GHRQ01013898.1~~GHRQ01013898.1.p1  ORF type:complete len:237 (+),score=99.41 GHRQ01013898.1:948-1658(+)
MMNLVCRAVGRMGNVEATGKVFQSYEAWGLQPDADSYNAVMESCMRAKKVAAVEGLISYMTSKGVEPNVQSWNILLSTAAEAKHASAAASAVERMLASGVQLLKINAGKALKLAHEQRSESLLQLLRRANEQQGLGLQRQAFEGWWRRGRGGDGGNGDGNGSSSMNAGRSGRVDTWQQGLPLQQRQQQAQGKQQEESEQPEQGLEQQASSKSEEGQPLRKSVRAGLAAALGAAMNQ